MLPGTCSRWICAPVPTSRSMVGRDVQFARCLCLRAVRSDDGYSDADTTEYGGSTYAPSTSLDTSMAPSPLKVGDRDSDDQHAPARDLGVPTLSLGALPAIRCSPLVQVMFHEDKEAWKHTEHACMRVCLQSGYPSPHGACLHACAAAVRTATPLMHGVHISSILAAREPVVWMFCMRVWLMSLRLFSHSRDGTVTYRCHKALTRASYILTLLLLGPHHHQSGVQCTGRRPHHWVLTVWLVYDAQDGDPPAGGGGGGRGSGRGGAQEGPPCGAQTGSQRVGGAAHAACPAPAGLGHP